MKIKLFTHTDLDGVGCAILAYLAFGQENVDVEYCDYKDIDRRVRVFGGSEEYKSYDKVYITDISISDELASDLDVVCAKGKIQLFDHHATALELNKYDWCKVAVVSTYTGIKTSGTKLFYQHLLMQDYFDVYGEKACVYIRQFVDIVCSYDTWRWKELGEDGLACKQLNDLFHIYGRDEFINWALKHVDDEISFNLFNESDRLLLENKQKDIDIYVEQKNKQFTTVCDNFGYTCGVVFAERYFSELGNKLSEMHPDLDYIAMIDIAGGTVSYRTISEDIDLGGEIAHSYGGGGHRKAAGSTFDSTRIGFLVMNELFNIENELI